MSCAGSWSEVDSILGPWGEFVDVLPLNECEGLATKDTELLDAGLGAVPEFVWGGVFSGGGVSGFRR